MMIRGLSNITFPWNANRRIRVAKSANIESGFNFGKKDALNHSFPNFLIRNLWLINPASKGMTTKITTDDIKVL